MNLAAVAAGLVCVAAVAGCGRTSGNPPDVRRDPETATPAAQKDADDIHSFARPEQARVTHVALDLNADFETKQFRGTATLTLKVADGSAEVVLDTQDLAIEKVVDPDGHTLTFSLAPVDAILGRALRIQLPARTTRVIVHYATGPGAAALQWLAPAQTAGGRNPYLFSQGQAILTRTWIPTQDSPGIRQTYEARITVPRELKAVMSAGQLTPDGRESPDGRTFEFRLTQPVPPYLIAIAIGDIVSRPVGRRTAVHAEPAVVEKAASEFADLERMIEAAERLYGPYRWGRFDVLVLPPSFPFGGMENPRLTFATPTILAGDRSLTSLIAHELAHSWSGNLVTNATWSDFWLNEGFTTYIETRIMEELYGREYADMLRQLGRRELDDELKRLAKTPGDTVLHMALKGRNPDDAATVIPYEKGAALLRTIEQAVGRERFDRYLRAYFERYAFQSITTATFLDDLRTHLLRDDPALEERLRIREWIYEPGLPPNAPVVRSERFARVEEQARAFAKGARAATIDDSSWSTHERLHFLASLPERLTPEQLADLDRAFGLSRTGNSEVLFAWLRIAIRHRYAAAMPALERFLTEQGRRKFLRPLYEDLVKTDWGRREAQRIYERARPLYHPLSVATIDRIVLAKR